MDGESGDVEKITNQISGTSVDVKQHFYWYASSNGVNINSSQVSAVADLGASRFPWKLPLLTRVNCI